jgi:hypothetical protein
LPYGQSASQSDMITTMKDQNHYIVYGWVYGDNYDANKQADHIVYVNAKDESQAEDLGSKLIEKQFDKCDVIVAQCVGPAR